MACSKISSTPYSALQEHMDNSANTSSTTFKDSLHLFHLALQIQHNLRYQHGWTQLTVHHTSPITQKSLSRPLIAGLPPKRLYIHPDEQIELLKHEMARLKSSESPELNDREQLAEFGGHAEREWVLPTHIGENWCLKAIAEIFDNINTTPPAFIDNNNNNNNNDNDNEGPKGENDDKNEIGWQWRGSYRQKRVLMATVHDDSTVVYYIVHDGIVKPRQN